MQTREPGTVSVYNDGVTIYIGITKEHYTVELEITTLAARMLAATLLENINEINKTLTVNNRKEV